MSDARWLLPKEQKYGASLGRVTPRDPSGDALAPVAGPAHDGGRHPALNPESPLLWVLALGAVTFGLAAFSTSVKVGPASATVKI